MTTTPKSEPPVGGRGSADQRHQEAASIVPASHGADKGPIAAEQSTLGALMLDSGVFDAVAGTLDEGDFLSADHQLIYGAIRDLVRAGKPTDFVTVFERLQSLGRADDCGGLAYLSELAQSVPSARNARHHAEIVRDRSRLRALAVAAEDARAAALDPRGRDATGIATVLIERTADIARSGRANGHPLLCAVSRPVAQVRAPEFIIDHVLQAGFVVVAGCRGVGKTTALLPLIAKCTHLGPVADPLRPLVRRRVVWVTEDVEQAAGIRSALWLDGYLGNDAAAVEDMLRIVPASRMPVDRIVDMAPEVAGLTVPNTRADGGTFDAMPVLVFDTKSAVIASENENDNAEASQIVAAMKQRLGFVPTVLIGHTPKAARRADVIELSARGADSLEADATQVGYLFRDGAHRFLHVGEHGKRRFESDIEELQFEPHLVRTDGLDVLGNVVPVLLRHCSARAIAAKDRHEAREAAKEATKAAEAARIAQRVREDVLSFVGKAIQAGQLVNRTAVRDGVGGATKDAAAAIQRLIVDGWLIEHDIRATHRPANNNRTAFLLALDYGQREQRLRDPTFTPLMPPIPPDWGTPREVEA